MHAVYDFLDKNNLHASGETIRSLGGIFTQSALSAVLVKGGLWTALMRFELWSRLSCNRAGGPQSVDLRGFCSPLGRAELFRFGPMGIRNHPFRLGQLEWSEAHMLRLEGLPSSPLRRCAGERQHRDIISVASQAVFPRLCR